MKRRNVKTSKRRNIQTSKRRNVETSKHASVETSKRQEAETSAERITKYTHRSTKTGSIAGVWASLAFLVLAGPVQADARSGELRARIAQLQQRVQELAGTDDLLDSLHFGWFDRPYARATLAILVKTAAVLEREARARDRGNGAIAEARVRAMLAWTDQALARVVASQPDPTFRPHRLAVRAADVTPLWHRVPSDATPVLPLFGFIDRATSTRHHDAFGDLDLMAAMGLRVHSRLTRDMFDPEANTVLLKRADELGMAVLPIGPPDGDEPSVAPVTLRAILESPPSSTGETGVAVALSDPPGGESWSASLARRALARGMLGHGRFIVVDFRAPLGRSGHDGPPEAIAAAMWVHAVDGQLLGLLPGWRDLRDGSGSPHPSVLLDPARVETMAHTALDVMRLAKYLEPFDTTPALAIAVDGDAIAEKDDNAWAAWIEPIWESLLARQIHFDVVGPGVADRELHGSYERVFPVSRVGENEQRGIVSGLEQALAWQGGRRDRVTARELDGRLAADVFLRTAATPGGKTHVALVNLSGQEREIKLHTEVELEPLFDVVADEGIDQPARIVKLAPWQVRLLAPVP